MIGNMEFLYCGEQKKVESSGYPYGLIGRAKPIGGINRKVNILYVQYKFDKCGTRQHTH